MRIEISGVWPCSSSYFYFYRLLCSETARTTRDILIEDLGQANQADAIFAWTLDPLELKKNLGLFKMQLLCRFLFRGGLCSF